MALCKTKKTIKEDDLKNENDPKNKDNFKHLGDLKNLGNHKNEDDLDMNTSLAALGALAHRLQPRTACKVAEANLHSSNLKTEITSS